MGREAIRQFLARQWAKELDYRLIKELWAFHGHRIAVRFAYEWHDDSGNWFRSYGNENWEFDARGLMRRRIASINDLPIAAADRKYYWPLGRTPRRPPWTLGLGPMTPRRRPSVEAMKRWLARRIILGALFTATSTCGILLARTPADWTEPFPPFEVSPGISTTSAAEALPAI